MKTLQDDLVKNLGPDPLSTHKSLGSKPVPTLGRILLYTLHEQDAEAINRRRTTGASIAEREVSAGEVFPMVVTRVWGPSYGNGGEAGNTVNGQEIGRAHV